MCGAELQRFAVDSYLPADSGGKLCRALRDEPWTHNKPVWDYKGFHVQNLSLCRVQSKSCLEGEVQPKKKILTSFTHSQVVPKPHDFFLPCKRTKKFSIEGKKNRELWKIIVQKQAKKLYFCHS